MNLHVFKMTVSDIIVDLDSNRNSNDDYTLVSHEGGRYIDLMKIPIAVIRPDCLHILSLRLNKFKVLLSENGLQRDWRGVLQLIDVPSATASDFMSFSDPLKHVLEHWQKYKPERATLGEFQCILGRIDRWDVLDDTLDKFGKLSTKVLEIQLINMQ